MDGLIRDVLEQIAAGTRPDGLEQVLFLVADRQHDDLGARGCLFHGPACLDAAALGHPDVHQHHIGQRLGGLQLRLGPVARLADQFDVVLFVEDHLKPAPEQRVIVSDQHADGLRPPCDVRSRVGGPETCAQPELLLRHGMPLPCPGMIKPGEPGWYRPAAPLAVAVA
jgi:hypothetical protein